MVTSEVSCRGGTSTTPSFPLLLSLVPPCLQDYRLKLLADCPSYLLELVGCNGRYLFECEKEVHHDERSIRDMPLSVSRRPAVQNLVTVEDHGVQFELRI